MKKIIATAIIAITASAVSASSFASEYRDSEDERIKAKYDSKYKNNHKNHSREEARNEGWEYKSGTTTTKEFLTAHKAYFKDYRDRQ